MLSKNKGFMKQERIVFDIPPISFFLICAEKCTPPAKVFLLIKNLHVILQPFLSSMIDSVHQNLIYV